jgi:hypothetical protein
LTEENEKTIEIENIDIIPYELREEDRNTDEFVIFKFDSAGYSYSPKKYNGVVKPENNLIMLLGGKTDLDINKWVATVNHELMHYILYFLEIQEKPTSETMVKLLEG